MNRGREEKRSRRRLDRAVLQRLARVMATIDSAEAMADFIEELLTPNEVHALVLRWHLLEKLKEGTTQRQIARELSISLCKITRGARILKQEGAITTRMLKRSAAAQDELEK